MTAHDDRARDEQDPRRAMTAPEIFAKLRERPAPAGDDELRTLTAPVGEFLADELAARNIQRRVLRRPLGLTDDQIDALITGSLPLTETIAHRLGAFLGTSAQLWLNLDRAHRGEVDQPAPAAKLHFAPMPGHPSDAPGLVARCGLPIEHTGRCVPLDTVQQPAPADAPAADVAVLAAESAAIANSGACRCTEDEACWDHEALEMRAEHLAAAPAAAAIERDEAVRAVVQTWSEVRGRPNARFPVPLVGVLDALARAYEGGGQDR